MAAKKTRVKPKIPSRTSGPTKPEKERATVKIRVDREVQEALLAVSEACGKKAWPVARLIREAWLVFLRHRSFPLPTSSHPEI